jgi:hypothetical protein
VKTPLGGEGGGRGIVTASHGGSDYKYNIKSSEGQQRQWHCVEIFCRGVVVVAGLASSLPVEAIHRFASEEIQGAKGQTAIICSRFLKIELVEGILLPTMHRLSQIGTNDDIEATSNSSKERKATVFVHDWHYYSIILCISFSIL